MKIERIEEIRRDLGLNKTKFAEVLGIKPNYYHQILNNSTSNSLRVEHLENLLSKKGVNPAWIMTGQGDKFIDAASDKEPEIKPKGQEPEISKKDLIKGVLKYSDVVAVPGDLAYDILDNLVTKTLDAHPDFPDQNKNAIEILSLSWISMLEFVQGMLNQEIDFQYGGKIYRFR